MDTFVIDLNQDYRKFGPLPFGVKFSNRIIDPQLFFSKDDSHFKAKLFGLVQRRGEVKKYQAPSTKHNWVFDGSAIRPLPSDITSVIGPLFNEVDADDLCFPDVLRISKQAEALIPVHVDESIFIDANTLSKNTPLDFEVEGLNADLYPYQENGVAWMFRTLRHTGGCILADEMGLGKTLQIITVLLIERASSRSPALVVCPTSLISNWCREIERFARHLKYLVHRGPERTGNYKMLKNFDLVICTYETVVNDITVFRGLHWSCVICDEAQAIKNPSSQRRIALSSLKRNHSIPVTGTPVENSLLDLWSLADFAIPGVLGSQTDFELDYPDSMTSAKRLSRTTAPITLKRRVKDVAHDLPKRIEIDLPIELGEILRSQYNLILKHIRQKYKKASGLVAVGQLSLFCAHPWLQSKQFKKENWEEEVEFKQGPKDELITPKLEITVNLIKETFINEGKVLVFAPYNYCSEIIQMACASVQIPKAYWNKINGRTRQEDRQAIVDAFSKHQGPAALVLNPKAAGSGLNIVAATVVIHYCLNWNPAFEMQASARAHRLGQKRPVTIYRLYYNDTIEDVMLERSSWKRDLANEATPMETRDKEDLKNLLNPKKAANP